jgi:hypothetical protein
MREKIMMFITYIEFFHKMHSKYLKRFSNKIQLMYTHISNDIKFDDSVEISKNKKKELLDEFVTGNMDKVLLKELKTSIGSETNSEVSFDGSGEKLNSPSNLGLDMSNSLISLSFPSPIHINERARSSSEINSLSGINSFQLSGVKEKKDFKKIFQKNVHKVTNLLQLCKPKHEKIANPKATDKEIQEMFNNIEDSCDSIINKNLEDGNIGLHIDSLDKEYVSKEQFISISDEESKMLNTENRERKSEQSDIIQIEAVSVEETKSLDESIINKDVESVAEELIVEEPIVEAIVTNQEPIIEEPIVEEPFVEELVTNEELVVNEEPESVAEEPVKKKRTYNKKKK